MDETSPPAPAPSVIVTEERSYQSKAPAANKRKRYTSTSTDSTQSSSSESSSSSSEDEKRRKIRKRNKKRRRSHHNRKLDQLIKAVGVLQNKITSKHDSNNRDSTVSDDFIDPYVSGDLFNEDIMTTNGEPTDRQGTVTTPVLSVVMQTKVKEPTIPRASEDMLQQLKDLQRFDQPDWNSVRYAEVQKQYLRSPGFTNLDPNEEIKRYDRSKFTANMENSFAGLTYALLKQREILQKEMNNFLIWAQLNVADLNYVNIHAKISEIFSQGEYSKVASDIMQLVCGYRTELVQHRREGILAAVKDPYHKSTLRKIPPSCSTLFQKDQLSATLDKAGGVNKIFWTAGKDRNSASQIDPCTSAKNQRSSGGRPNPQSKNSAHSQVSKHGNSWDSFRGRSGKNTGGRGQPTSRKAPQARANSPMSRRDKRDHAKKRY